MMQALLWLALAVFGFALSAAPQQVEGDPRKKAATAKSSVAKSGAKTTTTQRAASKRGTSRKLDRARLLQVFCQNAAQRPPVRAAGGPPSLVPRRPAAGLPPIASKTFSPLSSLALHAGRSRRKLGRLTVDALKRFQARPESQRRREAHFQCRSSRWDSDQEEWTGRRPKTRRRFRPGPPPNRSPARAATGRSG